MRAARYDVLVFLTLLAVGAPDALWAQQPYCVTDSLLEKADPDLKRTSLRAAYSLAYTFAPILEFAPDETYFPTVPFFPAFHRRFRSPHFLDDTVNAELIAPLTDGAISWNRLDSAYTTLQQSRRSAHGKQVGAPEASAVFFRVRCVPKPQSESIWAFLTNDPQAWRRSGLRQLYEDESRRPKLFQVIEYYFYYVNDQGLEGHKHDIESIFVFLPRAYTLEQYKAIDTARLSTAQQARVITENDDRLKTVIVVGEGHSTTTPNNVLVLPPGEDAARGNPAIIVEQGGHSSAPDRDGNAELNPGFDINWNLNETIWGTRDIQAVAGSGYLGSYQSWMTLPRPPTRSVTLKVASDNIDRLQEFATLQVGDAPGVLSDSLQEAADSLRDIAKERADSVRTRRLGDQEQNQPASADSVIEGGYRLLPLTLFQDLYRAAEMATTRQDRPVPAEARSLAIRVANRRIPVLLRGHWGFQGFRTPTDSVAIDRALHRMAYWSHSMKEWHAKSKELKSKDIATNRFHVWKARTAGQESPEVLKADLYRPGGFFVGGDVGPLISFGAMHNFGRGNEQHVSYVLPYLLPLNFIAPTLDFPGVFEYQIGIYSDGLWAQGRRSLYVGALYERHYKAFSSWYLKANWANNRAVIEDDHRSSDFTLGFGHSLMPFMPVTDKLRGWLRPIGKLARDTRLRTGFRIDTRKGPSLRRFEVELCLYLR